MTKHRILIADDHTIVRKGVKFLLETEFDVENVMEAESCLKTMELLHEFTFSHLILDMQLQDGNIMAYLPEIRKEFPEIPILIYSMSPEEIFARRAIQMGATSYLNKTSPESELIKALGLFLKKRKYTSSTLKDIIERDNNQDNDDFNPLNTLSDRETVVLAYLLEGLGVKQIAIKLSVKPNTVATFKARVFEKLGVTNLIELRDMAYLYNFSGLK